ncbi:MAG: DNA-binding protein [Rhodoblastus sp.]
MATKQAVTTNTFESNLSFSPEGLADATGTGRTAVFGEIKAGRLKARKLGRRTIILRQDAEAWLQSLPAKVA